MIDYIKNLLTRLQQYSSSLDEKEVFIDQPWILINDIGERHNYIFERSGNLIFSINGKVTNGSWRYIAASKALLITTSGEQFLLKNAFIDKGLMFLKLDGSPDKPWIFANENLIPDLDIQRYLFNVLIRKMQLTRCTINGETAFSKEVNGSDIYYDKDVQPLNTVIKYVDGRNAIVRNGRIVRIFYTEIYSSDKGNLYVEQNSASVVNVGDAVYLNGVNAKDGTYQISKKKSWVISNGKIVEIKSKVSILTILIFIILFGILCSFFYSLFTSNIDSNKNVTVTPTDSIISPSFTEQDYKNGIIKRFNYLAAKDFNEAAKIYSDTVNSYYGKKNVSKAFVTEKLTDYWGKHTTDIFLMLDTSSISVVQNPNATKISCNATDWFEDKDSKVPMIYQVSYSFTLNKNIKIIEEDAKINSQVIDSLKLLHLPENSSLIELRTNGNSAYFNAIFNDLNSDFLSPGYKNETKWALVKTLVEDFNVYVQDTSGTTAMNIQLFSNNLILQQMLFKKVLNFIMDASGRITGIVVELGNNYSSVADTVLEF